MQQQWAKYYKYIFFLWIKFLRFNFKEPETMCEFQNNETETHVKRLMSLKGLVRTDLKH